MDHNTDVPSASIGFKAPRPPSLIDKLSEHRRLMEALAKASLAKASVSDPTPTQVDAEMRRMSNSSANLVAKRKIKPRS